MRGAEVVTLFGPAWDQEHADVFSLDGNNQALPAFHAGDAQAPPPSGEIMTDNSSSLDLRRDLLVLAGSGRLRYKKGINLIFVRPGGRSVTG